MKLKLDNEDLTQDFFEDCRMLGIVAPIKDYQLCWLFNKQLRFDFRINNQIDIHLAKKEKKYFFPVYEFSEANSSLVHYVYNNHVEGEYLLPEFRHLDFLWLLKGDVVADDMLKYLMSSIRSIHAVQMVMELTNEKIRNKEHLLF